MKHHMRVVLATTAACAIAAGLAFAGGLDGPMRSTRVIPGNGTHVHQALFQGGQQAIVIVSGDGDSDLDLRVYDGNNNVVCEDDDDTDLAMCSWTPYYSANYRLRIRNIGETANRYWLRTN
jgi:hypothetical protein